MLRKHINSRSSIDNPNITPINVDIWLVGLIFQRKPQAATQASPLCPPLCKSRSVRSEDGDRPWSESPQKAGNEQQPTPRLAVRSSPHVRGAWASACFLCVPLLSRSLRYSLWSEACTELVVICEGRKLGVAESRESLCAVVRERPGRGEGLVCGVGTVGNAYSWTEVVGL
jgi:hypothetical protein